MVNIEQLENFIVPLGAVALIIVVVTVAIAALKHAIVRQLESKNKELSAVLEENTKNIAEKTTRLRELESRYNELQKSLTQLSDKNNHLKKEHADLTDFHEKLTINYDEVQKNYIQSLQTISQAKDDFEQEISQLKAQHDAAMEQQKVDSALEIERYGNNYMAEFEHLRKSHKRLAQANQTLSKTVDNAREERDFYRTELETLKNSIREKKRIQS